MSNVITMASVPDEAELLKIHATAAAAHLHLITNGTRSALCSIIPPGWRLMRVAVKSTSPKAA